MRSLRPQVLNASQCRGTPPHPHQRTSVRVRPVRQMFQAKGFPLRAQPVPHRLVPVPLQLLQPGLPHATAAAATRYAAHRREAVSVRHLRPMLPHQVRAEAAPVDTLRREAVRMQRVRVELPSEAILAEPQQGEPRPNNCRVTLRHRVLCTQESQGLAARIGTVLNYPEKLDVYTLNYYL